MNNFIKSRDLLRPIMYSSLIPGGIPALADSTRLNSLAPGSFQFNIRKVIFKLTLVNGGWGISYEIALRSMPQDPTDDKSTLVQVMAWCRQAPSHYLSQCWPRSVSPNGVTRPQWVNDNAFHHGSSPREQCDIGFLPPVCDTLIVSCLSSGERFTKAWLEIFLMIIQNKASILQWKFTHATTAVLSWHVQNFVVIIYVKSLIW